MAQIDKKHLRGLVFRGADRLETEGEDGGKKVVYTPFKRPLTPDDVLAVREDGDNLIFVASDGQKYTVAKGKSEG